MVEPGKIEGLVDVTQADRDAAAAVHDRMARVVVAQAKMAGVSSTVAAFPQAHDDYWLTQAFAHFRTTALTALRDELEQVRGACDKLLTAIDMQADLEPFENNLRAALSRDPKQ